MRKSGVNVKVYGFVSPGIQSNASYSLDGGEPEVSVVTNTGSIGPSRGNSIPSTLLALLYTSPILDNGQHHMTITNHRNTSALNIDYFLVTTGDTLTAQSSETISSALTTSMGSITTLGPNANPVPSMNTTIGNSETFSNDPRPPVNTGDTDANSVISNNSYRIATIIGVVATLAVVFFIIVCVGLLRRRKQKKSISESRLCQ